MKTHLLYWTSLQQWSLVKVTPRSGRVKRSRFMTSLLSCMSTIMTSSNVFCNWSLKNNRHSVKNCIKCLQRLFCSIPWGKRRQPYIFTWLTTDAAHSLMRALIHARIDYCNGLLASCPNYLTGKLRPPIPPCAQPGFRSVFSLSLERKRIQSALAASSTLPLLFGTRSPMICVILYSPSAVSGTNWKLSFFQNLMQMQINFFVVHQSYYHLI